MDLITQLKKGLITQEEQKQKELISYILEESRNLKIHPNEYMKIKGIVLK